jgi:transcriptional regulator GlxA family with amidase domain
VALCIDTVLHLLGRIYGEAMADEVTRILEYQNARAANLERFPPVVERGRSPLGVAADDDC